MLEQNNINNIKHSFADIRNICIFKVVSFAKKNITIKFGLTKENNGFSNLNNKNLKENDEIEQTELECLTIHIVNQISPTSMPVNEFAIYRTINNYSDKQILIVCSNEKSDKIQLPENLEVFYVGMNYWRLKNIFKRTLKLDERDSDYVFHLHQQGSAILFFRSILFTKIKNQSLFTIHSTYSGRSLRYKITSWLCALLAKEVNCVSDFGYEEYSSIIKKIKGPRFKVIPNGVDFKRISNFTPPHPSEYDKSKRQTLICVGRLISLKNQAFLLEVLSELAEYKLILIGQGQDEIELKKKVERFGLSERVVFKGLVPRESVYRILKKGSVYVSASKVEGLPISVLEAMSAGLVPILSDIGAHRDIANKSSCVHILPLNKELWKQKIDIIATDPNLHEQSNEIRQDVVQHFGLDTMHANYTELYSIIRERKA